MSAPANVRNGRSFRVRSRPYVFWTGLAGVLLLVFLRIDLPDLAGRLKLIGTMAVVLAGLVFLHHRGRDDLLRPWFSFGWACLLQLVFVGSIAEVDSPLLAVVLVGLLAAQLTIVSLDVLGWLAERRVLALLVRRLLVTLPLVLAMLFAAELYAKFFYHLR